MEYSDLLKLNDKELIDLINYTMKIYKFIKNKTIKYREYPKYINSIFFKYMKYEMSDRDKKCIALFLAGLDNNEYICDIIENNSEINLEKMCKYLKLSKNLSIYNYIGDLEEYYDDDFSLFFSRIINDILENRKQINAQNIFCALKDDDVCGSKIIEHIFKYFKLESRKSYEFEHVIFDEIEMLGTKKSTETIDEENESQSLPDHKKEKYNSKEYSEIMKYGTDLNETEYITNPALGREKEIDEMMASLLIDNSIILTGEAATGKTAIVEGLAYKIQNGDVHDKLKNKRIIKINTSSIVSGTKLRGSFEEKIEILIKSLINDQNLILFFDEMHTTIGAGSSMEDSTDMADMLKPYLDRGQIKMIGATTTEEYEKYISSDSAFKRRFERIKVNELDNKVIKQILKDIIYKMEKTTEIKFNLNKNLILDLIIELTQKNYRVYNDKINNPDISIKILKKAFAYAMLENNEEVKINNIKKAIENCDRIYDSVRTRYNNQLDNITFKNLDNKPKVIEMVRK